MRQNGTWWAGLGAGCVVGFVVCQPVLRAQGAAPQEPPRIDIAVDVIATTPLPGLTVSLEDIPSPVQVLNDADVAKSGALELSDLLNRRFNDVHVNEIQGNPFQADVNYRGYTASPLLGTPQGVSVYLDGVRQNQPFGDVVAWDLIPRLAVSTVALMPGSNPLFGLNTLGGAVSVQTKDGRSFRGTGVQATYGSDRRRTIDVEHGGSNASGLDYYLAGQLFGERGWRESSPSDVRQLFGKLGWHRGTATDVAISAAYANNSLTGNALQEFRLLARDYRSIYTKPDIFDNRATSVNVTMRHAPRAGFLFTGNVYYRHIRTSATSGDSNETALDQSVYQPNAAERAALAAAGYQNVPASSANASNTPFPSLRCIANVLLNDEPGEKCNGLINTSSSRQHNYGLSGQGAWTGTFGRYGHVLTVGGAYDGSHVGFAQTSEIGYLNPDRTVTGLGAYADGVHGGTIDGEPFDTRVDLGGRINTVSAYATDTITLARAWRVTLSGRFNRTTVANRDHIRPGGLAADIASLDGDHVFSRLNPAVGVTYDPIPSLNVYAGYSEGSRAATSIELGCANPEAPCRLPNSLAGDPTLDQVVAKTWEAGARSNGKGRVQWNVGAFRAENHNDILFVASPQTGFGYFKNFGTTRRQGFELGTSLRLGRATAGGGYTFLDATYQTAEVVGGSANSANEAAASGLPGLDSTITIAPGNRIPLVPRHLGKAFVDIAVFAKASVDVDLVATSGSFARGNENNAHQPDGTYYLGEGWTPGYAVVNLGGRYELRPWLTLVGQINNLFDTHYESAAQLGSSALTATGAYVARALPALSTGEFPVPRTTFLAPGAPRLFWVGTRFRF